jgi:hypothetical protein
MIRATALGEQGGQEGFVAKTKRAIALSLAAALAIGAVAAPTMAAGRDLTNLIVYSSRRWTARRLWRSAGTTRSARTLPPSSAQHETRGYAM